MLPSLLIHVNSEIIAAQQVVLSGILYDRFITIQYSGTDRQAERQVDSQTVIMPIRHVIDIKENLINLEKNLKCQQIPKVDQGCKQSLPVSNSRRRS